MSDERSRIDDVNGSDEHSDTAVPSTRDYASDSEKQKKSKTPSTRGERYMSFTGHLEELRSRLIKCIIAVLIITAGAYYFANDILAFLVKPNPGVKLQMLKPTTGFVIQLKIAFWTGIVLGVPIIAYHLWKFVAPGLFQKERKYILPIVFFTVLCFIIGAVFAFLVVIPVGLQFLKTFETEFMEAHWTVDGYISFITMMVLAFGVVFELPLIALFFGRIGIINHKMMSKYRRHAIVGAAIVGGVLTPPDPYTQILLGVPIVILYEVSIILVRIFGKKRTQEI